MKKNTAGVVVAFWICGDLGEGWENLVHLKSAGFPKKLWKLLKGARKLQNTRENFQHSQRIFLDQIWTLYPIIYIYFLQMYDEILCFIILYIFKRFLRWNRLFLTQTCINFQICISLFFFLK
jgi:hypothetical protein